MWLTRLLVEHGQVSDADQLLGLQIMATTAMIPPPRALLVHVIADEGPDHRDTFRSATCFAIHLLRDQGQGTIALHQPLLDLTVVEQAAIRSWLSKHRWPAWARADHTLRKLLGAHDAPMLLAEAARIELIPLQTLAKAAQEDRLPTIRAGDRQIIYLSTIREAQERGLLHPAPGRPRRT